MAKELDLLDIEETLIKNRFVFITDDVEGNLTIDVVKKLHFLSSTDEPITIFIFSDGGDPECAMSIVDTMVALRSRITIKTVVYKARSAAAYIAAMGSPGYRFAFDNSIIMLHKTSIELPYDDEDKQKLCIEFSKAQTQKMYALIAKACGKTRDKFIKDISSDLWLDSAAAKKYKIIDKVIKDMSEI